MASMDYSILTCVERRRSIHGCSKNRKP